LEAQLTLVPVPIPHQAEQEVFFQTGFIACHANIGFWTILMNTVCSLDPNHKPLFEFQVERSRGLVAIVLELDWTPTTALTGAAVRQELWKNPRCSETACDPERRFGYEQGPPALKKVYGSLAAPFVEDIGEVGPTTMGSFALAPNTEDYTGTGAVFQQTVTHWVSVFYNDEPAPDYSAARPPA
jgi:hypothetical protein